MRLILLVTILIFLPSLVLAQSNFNFQCLSLKSGTKSTFCFTKPKDGTVEDFSSFEKYSYEEFGTPEDLENSLKVGDYSEIYYQKKRELLAGSRAQSDEIEFVHEFDVVCTQAKDTSQCQSNNAPDDFLLSTFGEMKELVLSSQGSMNSNFAQEEKESEELGYVDYEKTCPLKAGWIPVSENNVCKINVQMKCDKGMSACHPTFYGENICVETSLLSHKTCKEEIEDVEPETLARDLLLNKQADSFDVAFTEVQTHCFFAEENENDECELISFAEEIRDELYDLERLGENTETTTNRINNDTGPIEKVADEKKTIFLGENGNVIVTYEDTDKTIEGHEIKKHSKAIIKDGGKTYKYLLTESAIDILKGGDGARLEYGDKLTLVETIIGTDFEIPVILDSKRIEPLKEFLEKCIEIIQSFFQKGVDLRLPKWQNFLKNQADLTLHRLMWTYLTSESEKEEVEEKVIDFLEEKLLNTDNSTKDRFDAIINDDHKTRRFLPAVLELVIDINQKQEKYKNSVDKQAFLFSSSDIYLLEIFANWEISQKYQAASAIDSVNYSGLVNKLYGDLNNKNNRLNQKEIEEYITSLSQKFKRDLREIVGTKCIDEEGLVCKVNIDRESILNEFMKDFSNINRYMMSGFLQREDSIKYLQESKIKIK